MFSPYAFLSRRDISRGDPTGVNDLNLVFHIDILILSCFAFCALLTIPRLLPRIARRPERFSGLFLQTYTPRSPLPVAQRSCQSSDESAINTEYHSDPSWQQSAHEIRGETNGQSLPAPPVLSWSSRFHAVSAILGGEISQGFTIGRSVVLLGYFGIILYAGVYKGGSPFKFWIREGLLTMSQVPIVFALATKNNILGTVLALGYEKINWLHRFIGRLMAVLASLHALGFFYTWSAQGVFTEALGDPQVIHGFMTLTGLNLLVWFSLPFFRQNYYRLFLVTHIIGFVLFPVGLGLHAPPAIPYIFAGVGVYLLDHIFRILKTRTSAAVLFPIPELGLTRIDIPGLISGWRPGQHVRIRVISFGMGWFGWCEPHPFTIAGVSGNSMVLMCKKAGDWTNMLYTLAQSGKPVEKGTLGRNVMVIVEGPYGGVGHTLIDSFSGALFFSGGSGITFSLPAIQDLILKDVNGQSRVKVIELVWSVKNPESLIPMLPIFNLLLDQAASTQVLISVYYTSAPKAPIDFMVNLPANITLSPGRPEISNILASMIDNTTAVSSSNPHGLVVGVCGPGSLGKHVRDAVGKVNSTIRKKVGGIELCEEVFSL